MLTGLSWDTVIWGLPGSCGQVANTAVVIPVTRLRCLTLMAGSCCGLVLTARKFDKSTHAWAAHGAWSSKSVAAALEREGPERKYSKGPRWRTQGFLRLSLRNFKHTFCNVLLAQQVAKSSQHSRGRGNQYHLTTGGTVHFLSHL